MTRRVPVHRQALEKQTVIETKPIRLRGQAVSEGAIPLICTPLVGRTRDSLLAELDAVQPKKPDVVEWRADYFEALGDTAHVIETARAIRDRAGTTPVLFTRRSSMEGGERIALTEPQVVQLYVDLCASRLVDLIDYETANAAEDFRRLRAASRAHGIALVGSYHNFQHTPDAAALAAKFALAHTLEADVAKVAVMPKTPADVLTLLGATYEASQSLPIPLISMSMGAYGSVSRMIGGVFGSALTFAVGRSSSAPGQIPIEELRAVLATVRRSVG
jgi:3-dehydroquinate dehydratase I